MSTTTVDGNRTTFCEQPDAEARKLARFVVNLATRHHKENVTIRLRHLPGPPALDWFAPDSSGRRGFAYKDSNNVVLRSDLRAEALVKTALHEVRHRATEGTYAESENELDAQGFARKWTRAYWRAYQASGGYASMVRFVERKPIQKGRSGQVAMHRTRPEVWEFLRRKWSRKVC